MDKLKAVFKKDKDSDSTDSQSHSTSSTSTSANPTGHVHTPASTHNFDEAATAEQRVAAPVQHERVHKHHHEDLHTVVEKEKHQDHYHTTIQPIKDSEVKPEKHIEQQAAVQERTFDHDDKSKIQETLAAEQAQFANTTSESATKHTQSVAPAVVGEHVHHHHHETIQPVIEKETVVPTVTHTTIPIHETHHEASVHHGTTVAPPMTAAEFKHSAGGATGSSKDL